MLRRWLQPNAAVGSHPRLVVARCGAAGSRSSSASAGGRGLGDSRAPGADAPSSETWRGRATAGWWPVICKQLPRSRSRPAAASPSGSGSGHAPNPGVLTGCINGCEDLRTLTQLVEQHGAAFNSIHAATALSRAAKLSHHGSGSAAIQAGSSARCMELLIPLALPQLAACEARQLANMAWAVAKLEHHDVEFTDQLLAHARPKLADFNPQGLANVAWAMATLEHVDEQFLDQLLVHAGPKLADFTPQALANTAWAMATLEHQDKQFLEQLLVHARPKLADFTPQALANTAWAMATLGHADKQFLEQLLVHARPKLADFTPQALANTAWAMATLGHADKQFLEQLLVHARPKLADFTSQALANTAWAMATLKYVDKQFLEQLLVHARPKLAEFTPQALANTAWAMATLHQEDEQFLEQLLVHARPKLADFTPQALANTAWAMATLHHADTLFLEQLLVHARPKLADFTPQALANTAWAMATLRHEDKQFLEQLLEHARPKLADFTPQALANTAWAMATLRHEDTQFLEQLLEHARPKLADFTPHAMANIAWAMATLNHQDQQFLDQLLQHPHLSDACRLNSQELCCVMWALSILQHDEAHDTLRPLLSAASALLLAPAGVGVEVVAAHPLALCQVHQYFATMQTKTGVSIAPSDSSTPPSHQQLRDTCRAAWADAMGQCRPSFTQSEVLQSILLLPGCADALSEQLTEDQLLSIDIALRLPCGTKVAVEVDGPCHFMSNAPTVPDGSTVWRNRMLEARGWRLVSIPVVEWSQQGQQPDQRRDYLLHKLAEAGIALHLEAEHI